MKKFYAVFFTSAFLSACASQGFNRGRLSDQLAKGLPQYSSEEIQKTFQKRANLPKDAKIGVVFKTPSVGVPLIEKEEKDLLIEGLAVELAHENSKSKFSFVPLLNSTVQDESSFDSIRMSAAQHGVDAVLVVQTVSAQDHYTNKWGWTYIFLATALFVKASVVDTLSIAQATLWDTRNGFLYITAEGEAKKSEQYVPAWGREDRLRIKEARSEALVELKAELKKQILGR